MNILSRYVASLYLKVMGLCLGAFVAIYLIIDFLEKIDRFSQADAPTAKIALFFLYKLPEIVTQVIPLAVLMATLLTLGLLAKNSEIVAMRSCGVSLPRLTLPILATAFAVSLGTLLVNEFVLPVTYGKMKHVEEVEIKKKGANAFFRQQNIWFRDERAIVQARLFEPESQTLHGITLWQTGEGMRPAKRIDAERAEWNGSRWLLKGVVERDIAGAGVLRTETLAAKPVELSLKMADLRVVDKYADNMGFLELRRYCKKLQRAGYDATRHLALKHSKLSLPFASFIMAFLGIPFALRGGRSSGIALGIAASLAIGFGYFVVNAVLLSFGQTGVLYPVIAAWAANVIFAMSGVWLAMTVNH